MYRIGITPYLDKQTKCYQKLISINKKPTGNLQNYVKQIAAPNLTESSFSECDCEPSCIYVIKNINDNRCGEYITWNTISDLVAFLIDNNYTIDTSLTKIMLEKDKDLVFYIKYTP